MNAIWDSAGRITDQGYEVEFAIPFSSLRFPRTSGPRARSKGDRRARSGSSVSAAQDDTTVYGRP